MTAKIRVRVGEIEVEYEGAEDFLESKLLTLLKEVGEISRRIPVQSKGIPAEAPEQEVGTLASILKAKNATTNQVRKFLVTAYWLSLKGNKNLKTSDVTAALKDSHQGRLGNAADCLNNNVSKGFCEKDAGGFYITPEGVTEVG